MFGGNYKASVYRMSIGSIDIYFSCAAKPSSLIRVLQFTTASSVSQTSLSIQATRHFVKNPFGGFSKHQKKKPLGIRLIS
jgi:hypothetical protein